jgi:hypothetical protein
MSYTSVVEMASSSSLIGRLTAAAAAESIENPEAWTRTNLWSLVSSPGWADQWAYAFDTATVNTNPDLGVRTDVISDGDILAAIQAVHTANP